MQSLLILVATTQLASFHTADAKTHVVRREADAEVGPAVCQTPVCKDCTSSCDGCNACGACKLLAKSCSTGKKIVFGGKDICRYCSYCKEGKEVCRSQCEVGKLEQSCSSCLATCPLQEKFSLGR